MVFLESNLFRSEFEPQLKDANRCVLITAYVTREGVSWVNQFALSTDISIVCRIAPRDFVAGSSDINALRMAIEGGWIAYCLPNLHAKMYLLDDRWLFVGSANLTGNGFGLSTLPNIEAMVKVSPTKEDLIEIDRLVSKAYPLTIEVLDEMEEYLYLYEDTSQDHVPNQWPRSILPEREILLVTDFPFGFPGEYCKEYEADPSLPFAKLELWKTSSEAKQDVLCKTASFRWLSNSMFEADEGAMYFGELTSKLHNDLSDDPKPYRREVKELLRNLLEYVSCYASEQFVIDQPKYSQRVRLIR